MVRLVSYSVRECRHALIDQRYTETSQTRKERKTNRTEYVLEHELVPRHALAAPVPELLQMAQPSGGAGQHAPR
jgi:hypothetical protein